MPFGASTLRRLLPLLLLGLARGGLMGADAEGAPDLSRAEQLQVRVIELRRELREAERELTLLSSPAQGRIAADRPVGSARGLPSALARDSATSSLDSATAWSTARLATLAVSGATVHPVAGTGSMRPTLGGESLLLTEPAPFSDLRVGDIVTYVEPRFGRLLVHRLIERYRDRFVARGDANADEDPGYVTAENYRGRVYAVIYAREPVRQTQ